MPRAKNKEAAVGSQNRTVGPNEAKSALTHCIKLQRPIMMWGAPGIGKSDIVSQITETFDNSHLIDIRLSLWEPTDIKGVPYYAANDNTMKWAPPAELPDAKMAKKYKKIILFLDEMNSAAPAVQAAAYQLILNRKVGTYKLPDNVLIVAAGNREADKGVTYRMPAPLANRFVHLELKVDFDDWFTWAVANDIHQDVVGCIFTGQHLSKSSSEIAKKVVIIDLHLVTSGNESFPNLAQDLAQGEQITCPLCSFTCDRILDYAAHCRGHLPGSGVIVLDSWDLNDGRAELARQTSPSFT